VGTFLLVSISILIVMGTVLEGAAALILFGPLLVSEAARIGIDPLQSGIVLVVSMGIGLFAPRVGLGLLLVIAFAPASATTLPRAPSDRHTLVSARPCSR
jgi:TRAP-type C4-dicarboxylate transport system permease large subunit